MSFLIDPSDVISYDRTDAELELFWLFCLVVAGKTATTQARLLNGFLNSLPASDQPENDSPFERIHKSEARGELLQAVIDSRLGQYNRLVRAFADSTTLDLRSCTVADLEAIHGVGPKTARMFLMMTRRGVRHAALDTHVLKYLRSQGHDVPKATPSAGKTYQLWENKFLEYADLSGKSVAEFDLGIWKSYSEKNIAA
jgi:thermostable 8-oxoguanine DNA glycosylase